MSALFTFTIGPVKSFVENGRKMGDLYAGSRILSELTEVAKEYLEKTQKLQSLTIIFPTSSNEEGRANYPNRLVAQINDFEKEKGNELAKALEDYVREAFNKKCKESIERELNIKTADSVDKNTLNEKALAKAYRQLEGFLEIYWLFQEYKPEDNYGDAYNEMFVNLQAIKSIRTFRQLNEPGGRKCMLHPEYNAIFLKKRKDGKFPFNSNAADIIEAGDHELLGKLKPGEALSAVAFFKRIYKDESAKFESVRYMLLKNLLIRSGNNDLYEEYFGKNPSSLKHTYLADAVYDIENQIEPDEKEYPAAIIRKAEKLHGVINKKMDGKKLNNYYALLKIDGDNMGTKYCELDNENEHRQLSEKICTFAAYAKERIENDGGACIYAGGEDILGFLPLENLWLVLKELHKEYLKEINGTFSAGIVISHLMQPLKDVMQKSGEAEHLAKNNGESKNAFAVMLVKRSGETRTAVHKFLEYDFSNYRSADYEKLDYEKLDYKALEAINKTVSQLVNKDYAKALVHDCGAILEKLGATADRKVIENLIGQIVQHKATEEPKGEEGILGQIKAMYNTKNDLNTFLNTLSIVGFLSREVWPYGHDISNRSN